jgi:GNAT superfamily N-acetyltransferase/catechol 2,3-dioxygenase-like lactoylglutathione lyase family enzyme
MRPAELTDLPALHEIELQTAKMFPSSLLPPEFARPLPANEVAAAVAESRVWVADSGPHGPVGFILFNVEGACLHIAEMDVQPRFGGRGIGRRLIGLARTIARALNLRHLTLTTFEHVPWNAPFYARYGFAAIRELDRFPHLADALDRERRGGLKHRVAMIRSISEKPSSNSVDVTQGEHGRSAVLTTATSMRRHPDGPIPFPHVRIVRPVSDLIRSRRMYCNGLGLRVIGSFEDHDGFDGVMLGRAGATFHFEFTHARTHSVRPAPTVEDLIVLYVPQEADWHAACARMTTAGFRHVEAFNPFWASRGRTFADHDGYRVVIQQDDWDNVESS